VLAIIIFIFLEIDELDNILNFFVSFKLPKYPTSLFVRLLILVKSFWLWA